MPNVFGRESYDYAHFQALQRAGHLDSHMAGLRQANRQIDFNSLTTANAANLNMMDANEVVAQSIGFLTNNLQAVQAEVDHILYTEFRLNEFFTLKTGIPEGATSYSYKVIDRTGKGKFITQRGTDAGRSGVSMENVPTALEYGGIFASWSIDELRNGQFAGIALDTETIGAATTGAMDHIEEVGLIGDAKLGLEGLTNNSDIPAGTTATTIANMTADELITFLQSSIATLISGTNEVVGRTLRSGMTIYLPTVQYLDVTSRPKASPSDVTVWEFVKKNNPWTTMTGNELQIRSVIELADAGAAVTDRMLVGVNDPKVMEMGTPIMPRTLTSQNNGFMVDVPIEYKIGGLFVKRPTALNYIDGV